MYPSMTGRESHAMTAAIQLLVMIAVTVNTAIGIIVRNVQLIAGYAIPPFVSVVHMNVPHAVSRLVGLAWINVKTVRRYSAGTA